MFKMKKIAKMFWIVSVVLVILGMIAFTIFPLLL